jgi:hydroxymethylglutaryl-CoA reductase
LFRNGKEIEVVMSILSNYVPNCIVRAVSCAVAELEDKNILHPQEFAEKFVQAVQIAEVEPYRAVTHNKGIMNGVDAVVLARVISVPLKPEYTPTSRNGKYSSLSHAKIENGIFTFLDKIPLALGTVGGFNLIHW